MEVSIRSGGTSHGREPGAPFRIVVLGDFSGHSQAGAPLKPIPVDRDNLDEVLDRLDVTFACEPLTEGEDPVEVRFGELDDFHPDHLFENVGIFSSLRRIRGQLLKSDTFARAADEMRRWLPDSLVDEPPAETPEADDEAAPEDNAELLDQLLDTAQREQDADVASGQINWTRVIRDLVEPYVQPGAPPQQQKFVECLDAVVGRTMTALLHHPGYREREAAWRGLDRLVRRLETDASLKICIVDISRAGLASDLSGDDPRAGRLHRLLVEETVETPGGQPWGLIVGHYRFSQSAADARLLGRLAPLADAAGAPFIAAADGTFVGCTNPDETPHPEDWRPAADSEAEEAWSELRSRPEADRIGLVWPSYVLRLPFGARTRPIDAFAYEEIVGPPRHGSYVWGHPALLAAEMLGNAFTHSGWTMDLEGQNEFSGLPLHIYDADGEAVARPCGELLLTERGAQAVAQAGLMPLLSVRGEDRARLPVLQAITGRALATKRT